MVRDTPIGIFIHINWFDSNLGGLGCNAPKSGAPQKVKRFYYKLLKTEYHFNPLIFYSSFKIIFTSLYSFSEAPNSH